MEKRWIVHNPDTELLGILERELKIFPLTAQLLANRGLVEIDKASSFLSPALRNLHDPFRMKDMDKAVERIIKAGREKERITVYGDYDVDGTSATALLYIFLKEVGFDSDYYIPERLKEGYGLNNGAIKFLVDSGTHLIITTDCGIANYDEVVFANSINIDVIVTDHHEPPSKIPPAYAILNPKQTDCSFPFKELAGVGVMFNLIIALRARLKEYGLLTESFPNLRSYTDIVALGTIADMVPLIDENRVLVKYGLEELTLAKRPGIKALKEVSGISGSVKTGAVGFQLAPRINAAGRLGDAKKGVRLFTTNDYREAMDIATELDCENIDRQRLEKDILAEAIASIEDRAHEMNEKKAIVIVKNDWHPGVIGIVASRLVDRYYRPAIVISLQGGVGKGSARGISRFHVLEGLRRCEGLLDRYGGHKMAAGFTISEENVSSFEKAFYTFAEKSLNNEDLVPEVSLDSYVELGELTEQLVREIDSLAPFGLANPEPLLGAKGANIICSEVVGSNHLKLKIKQKSGGLPVSNRLWDGIAYRMGGMHPVNGNGFDIAFIPYIYEWSGNRSLRLKVKEIKQTTD